jgi:hypothetical protein
MTIVSCSDQGRCADSQLLRSQAVAVVACRFRGSAAAHSSEYSARPAHLSVRAQASARGAAPPDVVVGLPGSGKTTLAASWESPDESELTQYDAHYRSR